MEAHARQTSRDNDVQTQERRRYARVDAAWPIVLESDAGARWRGKTVDFNQFGVKVELQGSEPAPASGTVVRLQVELPHGEPSVSLRGIVWRLDGEHPVIVFSNLTTDEFRHLKSLIDSFLRGAILGEAQA